MTARSNYSRSELDLFARLLSNRIQELILIPTEQCNFRCSYCYEDFKVGRMTPETVGGIKTLLERRSGQLDLLKIGWFGGEPLLAKDIVVDISRHAKALAEKHTNMTYMSGMSTNGYLLNQNTLRELVFVGITEYQITLDGPLEYHNRVRTPANQKGSFDCIWDNLIAIRNCSLPVKIILRIHFSPDNLEHLDRLIPDIKDTFLPDARFSIHFKSIVPLGGPNDNKMRVFPPSETRAIISKLRKQLYGKDIKCSETPYICYAAKPNSIIVRATGEILKCTVGFNDPHNKIGILTPDGTLHIESDRLIPWLRGIETLDLNLLSCPRQGLAKLVRKTEA